MLEPILEFARDLYNQGRITEAYAMAQIEWQPIDPLAEWWNEFSRQMDALTRALGEALLPALKRMSDVLSETFG